MKKKTKTFLVTGGTGFIGSNICKMLIKEGHKVLIYDNNSRGSLSKISIIKKKIVFIKGDIRDKKKVFQSIKKVNAVIHLAYINGTKYFYTKPDLILDIAVKGIVNILDGCKKYNVKELYLASSSEVYQTPIKVPTDENEMLKIPDIYNSRYSYGGGKIISELMSLHYGKKYLPVKALSIEVRNQLFAFRMINAANAYKPDDIFRVPRLLQIIPQTRLFQERKRRQVRSRTLSDQINLPRISA